MALVDLSRPGEKKKVIWAAVLGLVAIIFLWWTFFGFGSSSSRTTRAANPSATPRPGSTGPSNAGGNGNRQASAEAVDLASIRPVEFQHSSYDAPEARRNIFSYYVPPPPPAPSSS